VPSFHHTQQLFWVPSIALPLGVVKYLAENASIEPRGKVFIILSFIEIKQSNLSKLSRLRTCKFCKNRARDPPLSGNYIGKIHSNFFSFGDRKPYP